MPDIDDRSLEEAMRRGLQSHASHAPTTLTRPLPATRPRPGTWQLSTPARQRSLWPLAAAAALLVAVGIPVARFATDKSVGPAPESPTLVTPGPAQGAWRIESYAGVQLAVPPRWGYGGSPTSTTGLGSGPFDCGATRAFVAPGGGAYEAIGTPDLPFVGRPAMMTDACSRYEPDSTHPNVDAVWFASPLPVGLTRFKDGQVGQTLNVAQQHVTVFSRSASLRAQILDFATPIVFDANGCTSDPTTHVAASGDTQVDDPGGLFVCVYGDVAGPNGTTSQGLLWSTLRSAAQAVLYQRAVHPPVGAADTGRCELGTQWVAIGVMNGRGSATRWDIFRPDCDRIDTPSGPAGLTRESVSPWAGGGIRAYVVGPRHPTAQTAPYFRGILG